MLATIDIEGRGVRTVRCEDGFPGVVLADVLEPFGKRVDAVAKTLEGWARVRIERVPSRMGAQATTLLHAEDVPLALARLDQRGMSDETKELHTRFLLRCRDVLAQHFFPKASTAQDGATLSSARIGDDPAARRRLRLAMDRVCNARCYSRQKVIGYVRKTQRVSTPYAVSLHLLLDVITSLETIELGHVSLLSTREMKRLAALRRADDRQLKLGKPEWN